ncbi:MAG: hypothetical protein NT046_12100 [Arenimonas sp.]|nr:hypothetical protein [Arenimonas sp.]
MALLLARFGLLMASALCVAMVVLGATQLARSPLVFPGTLVALALVAGGAWAVADAWRLSRRLQAGRARRLRREPASLRFEARPKDSQQALAALLMLVVPLLLALAVAMREDTMAMLSSLLFAGLCAGSLHMLTLLPNDGRPALVMHARGLEHSWLGQVPWSQVRAVSLVQPEDKGKPQPVFMLALDVTSPRDLERRLPWIVRRFWRAPRDRGAVAGPVWLPLNGLDCEPRLALAAAQKFLAASRHATSDDVPVSALSDDPGQPLTRRERWAAAWVVLASLASAWQLAHAWLYGLG